MNLNLTRCNFINNTGTDNSAWYNYGLIFFGSEGSLNITYCNFVNNTAKNDYLIYLYSSSVVMLITTIAVGTNNLAKLTFNV